MSPSSYFSECSPFPEIHISITKENFLGWGPAKAERSGTVHSRLRV